MLPGTGPATAVAMLLPITPQVEAIASMIFFAGIYYGAMYGGSTTSILLNTPGESGSMVTATEGNKMAKNGRAGAALATAAIGSFVAGTISTVLVTFFAPVVATYAIRLGPPEYFLLMVLAFCTVSAVLGKSTVRGLTSLFVGLVMGLVGIDQITGQARYTAGVPELLDGPEVVLIAVGLIAVSEALYNVLYEGRTVETENPMSKVHMTVRDRPAGRGDAALRLPDRASGGGHDSRAAGRGKNAQCAVDRRGQVGHLRRAADVACAARGGGGSAVAQADGAAQEAPLSGCANRLRSPSRAPGRARAARAARRHPPAPASPAGA